MLLKLQQIIQQELLNYLHRQKELLSKQWINQTKIADNWQLIKDIYYQEIINYTPSVTAPPLPSQWGKIQTEINREIKLLNTDIIFLQSAKNSVTQQQRIINCRLRTDHLISYSEKLLELLSS